MVIFAAIAVLMLVLAGFILLARTDWGQQDATDPEFYTFLATFGAGTPLVWSALNLFVLATRSQTGGQYVAGLRLRDVEGGAPSPRQAVAWWFCLNPLLFSWPMALTVGLPLAAVIALVLSRATVVLWGVLITACIVAPLIALVSALVDDRHRAMHDRLSGVIVAPSP
jgi:hypothetical protein